MDVRGEEFVGEQIKPLEGTFDTVAMSRGGPGLPERFAWRKKLYAVAATLESWNEAGPDRTHGSGEKYLRRHWFRLRMATGETWTVYFERKTPSLKRVKARWYLYAIARDEGGAQCLSYPKTFPRLWGHE